MDKVFISGTGTVVKLLEVTCQMCHKPATTIIIPDWDKDFHVCDEHKQEAITEFIKLSPQWRK